MPGPWNDVTDRQLLMTIIHINVSKISWPQVAEMMGAGFTDRSTSQHFLKIKKEYEQLVGSPPAQIGSTIQKASTLRRATAGRKGKKSALASSKDDGGRTKTNRADSPIKKPTRMTNGGEFEDESDSI